MHPLLHGFVICCVYTGASGYTYTNEYNGVVIEAAGEGGEDAYERRHCDRGNEVWTDCGTACPRTCKHPDPIACILLCVPGCVCLEGFLRDESSGRCIPLAYCNDVNSISHGECIGEHEEWLDCGTACPRTCEQPQDRPCTLQCVQGCFCKTGFLRDALTGRCLSRCY